MGNLALSATVTAVPARSAPGVATTASLSEFPVEMAVNVPLSVSKMAYIDFDIGYA